MPEINRDTLVALLTMMKAELARSIAFKDSVAIFLGKSHISRLPKKALSTIFIALMAVTARMMRPSLPFLLSRVNQQWRTVVFQTPELWRVLDLNRHNHRAFAAIIPYFLGFADQISVYHSGWDVFFLKILIQEAMLSFPANPLLPYIRTPINVHQLTVTTGLELVELVAFHHTMPSVTCLKLQNIETIFPFALVAACESLQEIFLVFRGRRAPANFIYNSTVLYAAYLCAVDITWYPTQDTFALMRYINNLSDLHSIRLASAFGTNAGQWRGAHNLLRSNSSVRTLQLNGCILAPEVASTSLLFNSLGHIRELHLTNMDASGILILLGQGHSRVLGRLQILVLQTLVNCSGDILHAALLNLLQPDPNSWRGRKRMDRICSIEINSVSNIGLDYWQMIMDLSGTYPTVNWLLERAEE